MKKLILSIFCISMLLSGCSNNKGNSEDKDMLQTILDKGEITVITSPDYPPFEFIGTNGDTKGFDIELANIIAEELGVKLVLKTTDFDGVLASITNKQVDLAISGLTEKPDRIDKMDFSIPYYVGEQTVIVHKDNFDKYPDVESLKKATIAVQLASLQVDLANEIVESESQLKQLKGLQEVVLEVNNKNVDAAVISKLPANRYIESYPDLKIVSFNLDSGEGSQVAVAKGNNETLMAKINEIITSLIESGKIEEMMEQAIVDAQA